MKLDVTCEFRGEKSVLAGSVFCSL